MSLKASQVRLHGVPLAAQQAVLLLELCMILRQLCKAGMCICQGA
eukprot:CAMPEP_0202912760 /NCGR_PEP_ID=MMETSP1392-20130828/58582_1 /ASSEMBLY_ACC=CAM_ASM_000868 /TAXON_ID=225041 /ORGANISM="Chlamydomonas chlamydogama, Strain SAG 11-48b" /LENGTH=44 /DNA_ID= /DNA_START= /DNA_END= /DNA_ORIENTATION=